VPKLRELDYLQGQTSEDYLVEVSYLNHRIVFPEVFREEANRPYERFRESFEHLQTKLPAHGDVAAKRKEHPIIFVHIHKYGGTSMCPELLITAQTFLQSLEFEFDPITFKL
jgi:hypothetical protein